MSESRLWSNKRCFIWLWWRCRTSQQMDREGEHHQYGGDTKNILGSCGYCSLVIHQRNASMSKLHTTLLTRTDHFLEDAHGVELPPTHGVLWPIIRTSKAMAPKKVVVYRVVVTIFGVRILKEPTCPLVSDSAVAIRQSLPRCHRRSYNYNK